MGQVKNEKVSKKNNNPETSADVSKEPEPLMDGWVKSSLLPTCQVPEELCLVMGVVRVNICQEQKHKKSQRKSL